MTEIDLTDPRTLLRQDVLDDPRALHDRLRCEAPVWQIPGQDTFVVSDPGLIREAVIRTNDFSSNLVSLLYNDGTGCPMALPMAPYGDPIHVLSTADPPLHTRHRKLLQSHLHPAAVAALEPAITRIVDEQLDHLLAAGRADAVNTFSDAVPSRVIGELVGIPADDVAAVRHLSDGTGALLDGITEMDGITRAITCAIELTAYVERQVAETLRCPAADRRGLLAVFADGIETGTVNAGEVRDMMVVLVTAGAETTASLIATAIETLARDSALQDTLRREPSRIPDAIEGMLRDAGPFQFHYRHTPHDTSIGGVDIPAGSRVLLMWAAANRPAADSDGATNSGPHFAFGRGAHFCIGAPVARLEAKVALERLLDRTSSITLDPEAPMTRRPSIFIRRHATLPVIVTP